MVILGPGLSAKRAPCTLTLGRATLTDRDLTPNVAVSTNESLVSFGHTPFIFWLFSFIFLPLNNLHLHASPGACLE
jgi:hypothetical protein